MARSSPASTWSGLASWHKTSQLTATDARARGDPQPTPLDVVAKAVLALGWPNPTGESRTMQKTFVEVQGRYRHCDVYWAMHERLKGRELECNRAYWRLRGE